MKSGRHKRVLFLASQPFFQWRGSPIRIRFDVEALVRNGLEVDLLTLPVGEPIRIAGVRILRVPRLPGVREVSIGPSLIKAVFDVFICLRAFGLAVFRRYAAVHGVEDTGILAWLVGRLTGARVVFEKHSDPGSYRGGPCRNVVMAVYAAVERFVIRHADAVIGTGPGLVRQATAVRRSPERVYHIFDIPSSLAEADVEQTRTVREQLQDGQSDVLATFVGSFAAYQGVDLLFAAIPLVVRRHRNVRFVIIGGTPSEIEERRRILSEADAADRVTFVGKVAPDVLPDYLSASDILLSPRLAGVNTPLKLLDYFKAGRAIVATDVASNRLILDESTALLAEPTPEAFARGICSLAGDPDIREKLGGTGRRQVEERYNMHEFTRGLAACYRAIGIGNPAGEGTHADRL